MIPSYGVDAQMFKLSVAPCPSREEQSAVISKWSMLSPRAQYHIDLTISDASASYKGAGLRSATPVCAVLNAVVAVFVVLVAAARV